MSDHPPSSTSGRAASPARTGPASAAGSRPAVAGQSRSVRAAGGRSSSGLDIGLFIVLLLILIVLFAQTARDSFQLNRDRLMLKDRIEQQVETLDEAQKVRAQLEAIAGDTATLAEAGNPNAIQLRDFLAQKGVTIRPPGR